MINLEIDLLRFIGLGYGSNILLYFISNSPENMHCKYDGLFFNTFVEID